MKMFQRNLYYSDGKKAPSFKLFIVPVVIFLTFLLPSIKKYPALISIVFATFGVTIILSSLCLLYVALKTERYVQKHDLQLWEKSKSHSFKDRREAGKAMRSMSMQIPCLEKSLKYANKIAFALLLIWTLIVFGVSSFIIFSNCWFEGKLVNCK